MSGFPFLVVCVHILQAVLVRIADDVGELMMRYVSIVVGQGGVYRMNLLCEIGRYFVAFVAWCYFLGAFGGWFGIVSFLLPFSALLYLCLFCMSCVGRDRHFGFATWYFSVFVVDFHVAMV